MARTPPTGLTATVGNTQVTLTWTDPDDATITVLRVPAERAGLRRLRSRGRRFPAAAPTTTSYRLTGLDNGTAYIYRIRARTDGTDVSLASDTITVTPQGRSARRARAHRRSAQRRRHPELGPTLSTTPAIQEYEYQYKIGAGFYRAVADRTAAN